MLGAGREVVGRKQAFGMELAGVLKEVRNPGHPSCSLRVEGGDPVPTQPALPHTHLVPGSAWACLASLHTSHSTAKATQLGDRLGRRLLWGARRSLTREGGEWEFTLRVSDVLCECLGVGSAPWRLSTLARREPGLSCCGLEAGNETGYTRTGAQLGVGTQRSLIHHN